MTRYLLETCIASDYIHRRNRVFERARAAVNEGHRVGIGTPVLGEILGGVLASATRDKNLPTVERNLARFVIWPFDEAAAREYGRLWAELKHRGRFMQAPEIQIAAIALCLGNGAVVSKDTDLRAVPGLKVEDWSQP